MTGVYREADGVLHACREYGAYGDHWTRTVVLPLARCRDGGLRAWADDFVLPDCWTGAGSRYEHPPVIRRLRQRGRTWGWMIQQSGGYDV